MRILLLTHTFNSLAQKVFAELKRRSHLVSVEYDISDQVTESAVIKFKPDLIIAPFLKRAIPESVWKNILTLIIHPGPPGDRGPSSLDWAILNQEKNWGVTIIEASSILDGGAIWAYRSFAMRNTNKGSLYRQEISNSALDSLLEAIDHIADYQNKKWSPKPSQNFKINSVPAAKQCNRKINWQTDSRDLILTKINSADGSPGVLTTLNGKQIYLFDAKVFPSPFVGEIGIPQGICDHGVIINTMNGPITIGHVKDKSMPDNPSFKKSAEHFFDHLPRHDYPRIHTEYLDDKAFIIMNFYNGAMGIKECHDLRQALINAKNSSSKVIVLKSESGFFSNGIHLNEIEAADIPADYAFENIKRMNDLVAEIITCDKQLTVAMVDGNASAGGVLLARAHDVVIATENVIFNPHYKNMGNLYGSEYWTYLLPKYLGEEKTKSIMSKRLPMEMQEAKEIGLVDQIIDQYFDFDKISKFKKATHNRDQTEKTLKQYGEEELEKMKENFYGFDPSFHLARYNFVRHIVKSKTPLHLAIHRV
jgi:putative two-component system hydrogenase maturation factor HypX/HoxX